MLMVFLWLKRQDKRSAKDFLHGAINASNGMEACLEN